MEIFEVTIVDDGFGLLVEDNEDNWNGWRNFGGKMSHELFCSVLCFYHCMDSGRGLMDVEYEAGKDGGLEI